MNDDSRQQVDAEDAKAGRPASPPKPETRDPITDEIERETERAADAPITESSSDDSRS